MSESADLPLDKTALRAAQNIYDDETLFYDTNHEERESAMRHAISTYLKVSAKEEPEPGSPPVGTKVQSKNWAKPYGHVIGWDDTLEMVVIRWDGAADHGPEACEPNEFKIIGPTEDELRLLRTIKELDESIALEQALDSIRRKASK